MLKPTALIKLNKAEARLALKRVLATRGTATRLPNKPIAGDANKMDFETGPDSKTVTAIKTANVASAVSSIPAQTARRDSAAKVH